MKRKAWTFVCAMSILTLTLLSPNQLHAQVAGATLSGTVANQSGAVVPNAKISVKNVSTGQSVETLTDLPGLYTVPGMIPGTTKFPSQPKASSATYLK
jgi:hypothetical protein